MYLVIIKETNNYIANNIVKTKNFRRIHENASVALLSQNVN